MALTSKQRAFVQEFMVDSCATKAAIRAGYSERSAGKIGHQLLENTRIAKAIEREQDLRAERLEITADRVAIELARIAFADMRDIAGVVDGKVLIPDTDGLSEKQAAAISELAETSHGIRIKMHSKTAALDQLGKILGLHREALEVTNVGEPPVFQLVPVKREDGAD